MSRPTLSAVAARAGVSVSTASIAFSGSGPIAPATRERVLSAAQDLGYTGPSPLGRQLRSGRSGIIGVVVGDHVSRTFRDPVAVKVLDGLVAALGEHGLGVLLVPGVGQDADPLLETAAMDVVVLVWGARPDDPTYEAVERRGLPVVIGEGADRPGVPLVGIADRAGTATLGEHLLELGHRDVAVVTLPFGAAGPGHRGPVDAQRRGQAVRTPTRNRLDGLADAGIEPVVVWETEASLVEEGRTAGLALLDVPAAERPTAVVAQSDLLAAGVVLAARDLGLSVPGDVSVAGFDGVDLPWLGEDRLTSVRQPLESKGAALGRAVLGLLAGDDPGRVVLDVELAVGTTTGPAPR